MPNSLQELVDRLGGRNRVTIALAGIATVAVILGLSQWATRPKWVQIYSGLSMETNDAIVKKLDEDAIPYRLEGGGSVLLVSEDDVARVRVSLAGQGLPEQGRPGMELFDQPSWGMTDFAQRINYRRALEGELERTIGKMRGIESAQVHLAMHETSSFRAADRPAEASVVLKLSGGTAPAGDVVQGIAHLVASSIDGLESSNVAVLDDAGRLLSTPAEAGSLTALTSQQLGMQREIEQYMENKAQALLTQFVGPGNARVQVSASLNFDRVERTTESVDPDGQVLASEQRSEITPGAEGGAGSSTSTTQYQNSRVLETYSGAPGNLTRLTIAVLVNDRMTPAAEEGEAPTYTPRTAEELARIETLVRSAVGADEQRGDLISVVSVPFDAAAPALPEDQSSLINMAGFARELVRPVVTIFALLLSFIIFLRVYRTLKPPAPPAPAALAFEMEPMQLMEPEEPAPVEPFVMKRTIPIINTVMRDRVVASVEEHPNLAARLVRAWMKEA